ncbi:MAG: glycosyltransferase family 2 protein [Chloroflexi bacterium]|nr:glycosyltransferase family 2 protein [Chloroflexota bacterium]
MTTLSVIIPAYNEEAGIQEIMTRVLAVRDQLHTVGVDDLELIVVDDGSKDRTPELVMAQQGVRLIRHAKNGGYGAALKTGFAAAQGEWVGFLDADGTYPPEYYPNLYTAACEQNADIVIGSRMAGAASEMPAVRRLGNLIFARLVSLISARRITDSASGMRIFKKSILSRLYPLPDGLNLTPVMSTRALHEQLTMVEVAIPYSERVGRSKLSVVKDGMRFAQSIVWTALTYNPVRPLGLIGMAALIFAFVVGLGLVFVRAQGIDSVGPLGAFTLFAALVLAVAGVSVLTLGMSFNYFVALFHKSPIRQGILGRPLFNQSMARHFGWGGLLAFGLGIILGAVSLSLGMAGWPVARLWLYYLTSACLALVGIQLTIAWVQMQVLDSLRIRDALVTEDLQGKDHMPATGNEFKVKMMQPQA